MEEQKITVSLAGVAVTVSMRNPETKLYFAHYPKMFGSGDTDISATEQHLAKVRCMYPPEAEDSAVEFSELALFASDALLPYRRCIFHGVAFIWRGKAYIFTAPSGTGKTTQYILWKMQFGEEIRLINGDKPIIRIDDDNRITVHHSPWRGKEGMGRPESAELGGIILLAQGKKNEISLLEKKYAVAPIFKQFLFSGTETADVHRVAGMAETVLNQVPVWRLINRGDPDSVKLCSEAILRYGDDMDA